MTVLLDISLPRTLDALVERFATLDWAGSRLEAWLFEGEDARRAAEAALAAAGVSARLRSAYKPLLHAFLEEELAPGSIRLPAHPQAVPGRFALEAYPLLGLTVTPPAFVAPMEEAVSLDYVLSDGTTVFAPNRTGADAHGRPTLSACGWLRVWRGTTLVLDEHLETEFEQAYAAVTATVAAHPWPATIPLFPTLWIEIATGGIQRRLDWSEECIDTREALHEDLYFSLIEFFQVRAGLEPGARTLQPGQIVPDITEAAGPTRVRVRIVPRIAEALALGPQDIETAERALDPAQIAEAMANLGGEVFTATSVQGREIAGLHRAGTGPGLVVTAGQHANETSGVVGLLRAAPTLQADPTTNVALIALENPDGYALHQHLCQANPRHMHHAARYTALGDDLEARQHAPFFETAGRREAVARTNALLHISLHGYPAQEWTRPMSGYVPVDFAHWTLPCGFFLILRHHPGREAQGMAFLEQLTAALAEDEELVALNRTQLALRAAHAGPDDALVLNDIPCRVSESLRSPAPFVLITEYPDETIHGPAFQLAHRVQRATVLAAATFMGLLQA